MTIKVARVIDNCTLVLNKGSKDSIKIGQRFLVYIIGEQITDPDTGAWLEKLEVVKGTGKVTHLQESISTITSDMKGPVSRTVRKVKTAPSWFNFPEEITETIPSEKVPFEDPQVGDLAKPV